jgi:methylmalonyl-CoA mutase
VAATAAEKLKAVARRRDTIVGVNQYANPREKPLEAPAADHQGFYKRRVQQVSSHRTSVDEEQSQEVLQRLAQVVASQAPELFDACVEAVTAGATLGEITRSIRISDTPLAPITPVCLTRAAAGFERLRAATERYAARSGERPKVFLCNMGPLKEHKARADFSRGFLSVAGYEVISPEGMKTPEAAAEAFAKTKASIAVICSIDDNYPALVPPLVQALKAKNPKTIVILAGYPQDQIEAHKKAGVDDFIHIRADALELLTSVHSKLGID